MSVKWWRYCVCCPKYTITKRYWIQFVHKRCRQRTRNGQENKDCSNCYHCTYHWLYATSRTVASKSTTRKPFEPEYQNWISNQYQNAWNIRIQKRVNLKFFKKILNDKYISLVQLSKILTWPHEAVWESIAGKQRVTRKPFSATIPYSKSTIELRISSNAAQLILTQAACLGLKRTDQFFMRTDNNRSALTITFCRQKTCYRSNFDCTYLTLIACTSENLTNSQANICKDAKWMKRNIRHNKRSRLRNLMSK